MGILTDLVISAQMMRDSVPSSHLVAQHVMGSIRISNTFIGLQQQAERTTSTIREIDDLLDFRRNDFFRHYRTTVLRHQDDVTPRYDLHHMTNGVIASPAHRYIIAQDYLTKELNSFWARETHSLRSEVNPDTCDPEFVDDEFRYHWGTYDQNTPKSVIHESIQKHVSGLTQFGHEKMTVYGGDYSSVYSNSEQLKTYGYSNDGYGVSIHEVPKDAGGGWLLKLSRDFEKNSDAPSFVDVDNFDPKKVFLKAIISNGIPFAIYPTQEEAQANMHMMINQRSQMVWSAGDPASLTGFNAKAKLRAIASNAFTITYNFAFKQLKDPENKQEAVWDVIMTMGTALAARAVALASLPLAVAGAIAMNFGNRKAMNFAFKGLAQNVDYIFRGPKAIVGHEASYVADNHSNMLRRFNRKPNTAKNRDLIVLNQGKLDLTRQDAKQKCPRELKKAEKELSSHGSTAYSRKVSQIDRDTSSDISFNGVVRLVRFNRQTGAIETYVKYIEALDINPKISISQAAKDLLKDGKILKLTQPKGTKTIASEEVSFHKMRNQVKEELCCNVADEPDKRLARKAAFGHISWLFNNPNHDMPVSQAKPYVLTAMHRIDIAEPMKHIITPKDRLIAAQKAFGHAAISLETPTQELVNFFKGSIFPSQSLAMQ